MQAIVTKFIPATDKRGNRIKVTSQVGSKSYAYDYGTEEPHKAAFVEWLNENNAKMAEKYGTESPRDGWFKLVAYAGNPDQSGFTFIIK